MPETSFDVFISYSFKDKSVADQVYGRLQSSGLRPWMAPNDITPGEEWSASIIRAIGGSRVFALIFSDASNYSDDVLREIRYAASLELPILPYRVQDCPLSPQMEYFIGTSHWLNAYLGTEEEHLGQLVDTVSRLLNGRQSTPAERGPATPQGHVSSPAAEGLSVPVAARGKPSQSHSIDELLRSPQLLRRSKVGNYILEEPVGAGGTGIVFRARHEMLGHTVCVKLFYPMSAELAVVSLAMRRGMRGLAALNHPHIIKLHDFGSTTIANTSLMFLVMEMVSGCSLTEWTHNIDPQPNALPRRLKLAYRLANAMATAHRSAYTDEVGFQVTGVLHGDLKPGNILVRPDDSPVVLDFMMADLQRLLDPEWQPADTRDFEPRTWAYGSPGYMPPEQEEQGVVRVESDVYGLGITLIQLFFPHQFGECEGRPAWPGALQAQDDGLDQLRGLLRLMVHPAASMRLSCMESVMDALREVAQENGIPLE